MKKKTIVILILIAIAVFAVLVLLGLVPITPLTGLFAGISKESIGDKVKNLYELSNPGTLIEIVTTTEESGLYKIVLKATDMSGTTYREVYVTKDGKLLTETIILVEESIAQIKRMKDFVDCLDAKGVRIFGVSNQTASLLQLNILGRYGLKLFVACDINMDSCIAFNITQVPSVVIGRQVIPGVKNIDWFEQVTDCEF